MASKQQEAEQEKRGVSKVQMAIGAASLFLFIVGLKRSFRVEEERDRLEPRGAGARGGAERREA